MSAKSKKAVLYSSPAAILVVLVAWVGLEVRGIQHDAETLAHIGQEAIRILKEYANGIKAGDSNAVLDTFSPGDVVEAEIFGGTIELPELSRDGVTVYEWLRPEAHSGGDRARSAENQLTALLYMIHKVQGIKFKLDRVETVVNPEEAVIRAVLWMRGSLEDGQAFESHSVYRMRVKGNGGQWFFQNQKLISGRVVTGVRTGFREVSKSARLDFQAGRNPLFSTKEWDPARFGILRYGSAGVSATDFDNDGWYDVFFADGAAPALYRNMGDGTFADITAAVGLPTDTPGINVGVFSDFDNDGDQDLFLGCFTATSEESSKKHEISACQNSLFRNNLKERQSSPELFSKPLFTDETTRAGLKDLKHFVTVAAVADYDNDGLLDIYVGRYLDPRTKLPTTLFYTRNGEGNSLLRNRGDMRFDDVTEDAGVREGGLTLGVAWGDYNEDNNIDLYVANDFGRNALLKNNGDGTFTDVSAETGTLDFGFGMSADFGDVDNDGDLDIYVSNVHSGQRWYGQAATLYQYLVNSLSQGTILEDFPLYREIFRYSGKEWKNYGDSMVKGNSLFLNDSGRFRDVAEEADVNPFGWYWSSTFFDYDNDGRQDIYAANGWITADSHDDL